MKNIITTLIVCLSFCSCKQTKAQTEQTEQKKVATTQSNNKKSLLDVIDTNLNELKYQLHPYSGYPLFSNNNNKDYFYALTVISQLPEIKDNWVFDELTYNDNLIMESKTYVLNHLKDYKQVLLIIEDSLYEQDGVFNPSENFNYKIYFKENKEWVLKEKNKFEQDFFIFLDSFFIEKIKSIE